MKASIKNFGSFQNWLMSNNNSLPVAGEWATIMSYSDRDVVRVFNVSKDNKSCVIEYCHTKAKQPCIGMGHQDWEHTPNGQFDILEFRRGKWCRRYEIVDFTKEFEKVVKQYNEENDTYMCAGHYLRMINPDAYNDMTAYVESSNDFSLPVMDGITKKFVKYSPVNIVFGVCDYHYDWSF